MDEEQLWTHLDGENSKLRSWRVRRRGLVLAVVGFVLMPIGTLLVDWAQSLGIDKIPKADNVLIFVGGGGYLIACIGAIELVSGRKASEVAKVIEKDGYGSGCGTTLLVVASVVGMLAIFGVSYFYLYRLYCWLQTVA